MQGMFHNNTTHKSKEYEIVAPQMPWYQNWGHIHYITHYNWFQ
jgi:hypothetical protein